MAHQEDREERMGRQGCGWHDFDQAVCPRCRQKNPTAKARDEALAELAGLREELERVKGALKWAAAGRERAEVEKAEAWAAREVAEAELRQWQEAAVSEREKAELRSRGRT